MRTITSRVSEIMTTPAWTLQSKETLRRARYLLQSRRIRYAPVLDGERLIGVLTESDLRAHLPPEVEPWEGGKDSSALDYVRVGDVMTNSPISIGVHHLLTDAARVMLEQSIGALPVVDGRRLVGIVTRTNLLQALFDCIEDARDARAVHVP